MAPKAVCEIISVKAAGRKRQKMARIPLQARLKNVPRSKDDRARRKIIDRNATAERVVEHLHRLIAQSTEKEQQYYWADIARQLSLSADEVGEAVKYGSHHGIRVVITDDDQAFLSRYR